jgi:hypothetical protein
MRLLILVCFLSLSQTVIAQDSTVHSSGAQIPTKYFETVSKKADDLQHNLDKKTQKVLARMQKAEAKLKRKLVKIDSLAANNIFSDAGSKYKQLEEKLKIPKPLTQYVPRLDTLITSFKFLEQHPEWLGEAKDVKEKLNDAFSKVKELESQLQKAEDIKQFIKQRKEYLKEQLEKFGLGKKLKSINKEVYYYTQQINEYKEILKDPKKIERKAIELLSKTKLFQEFFRKNSLLASLFRMPGDPNDPNYVASLAGLQTRTQVSSLIQNQIAAGGANAQQQFSQNLQTAQSQLQQLKDKINKWGGGSSDDIMPEGFKPNPAKSKTFLQRFTLGSDFQTTKHNNLFPIASDVGISISYTLNANSHLSIGSSFKIGWGTGFNHIQLSAQGASIRGGLDWRLKGNFFIAGKYEQNYFSEIRNISQLNDYSSWKTSALLGINKKYKTAKKRSGEISLLYDFFYNRPPVKTQPIIFRIAYILK